MNIENKPAEYEDKLNQNNNIDLSNQISPNNNENNINDNNIINNNINNNNENNIITNNEKEKKNIYNENGGGISIFLKNFAIKEKNKQLDELISDLKYYKDQARIEGKKEGFKQTLYENLEKNLIELCFLTNNQIQKERLHKLYIWYKNKKESFEDLKKISAKSYKEKGEIDDLDVLIQKEEDKKLYMEMDTSQNNNTLQDYYKHRNKDMLFKDMLNDYKRKLLINQYSYSEADEKKKQQMLENDENVPIDKNMYKTLSMASFKNFSNNGEMSTFYSTKNGQNSFSLKKNIMNKTFTHFEKVESGICEKTFYSQYNKENNTFFPPLNRETKFSYSFNRPAYNYYSVYAENKIIQNKMKNLAEKRSREEIDEKMNVYGYQKSKLKESIINKYELRDIVNMYANTNDFNSTLLEKYKFNSGKDKKWYDNNLLMGQSKISSKKNNNKNKNDEFIGKKEKLFDIKGSMKRSQSCNVLNYNNLEGKIKMQINKVKNLDINTKSILENNKDDIRIIKMKLKQPKEKITSKLLNYQHNCEKIPNDVIPNLIYKNSLFKQKILFNNICGTIFKKEGKINKVDTGDDSESEYRNFYMSAYDFANMKKIGNFRKVYNRNKFKKPIHENINKTFNLNKDNYLNFRKTMSSWKKNDFEKLFNKIIKNKENISKKNNSLNDENRGIFSRKKINIIQRKQNSLLKAMVNPIEDSSYSQYFLPRSGSMLLKRNEQNIFKNKKNKRKK